MLKPAAPFEVGVVPFNTYQRERAARIGEIYCYIFRERALPLGEWALPSAVRTRRDV
jgi:hypothetical protein